jgi:glutathione S-transferase
MKFYFSPGAVSFAPHVILNEVGEPFESAAISLKDGSTRSAEFLRLNPKGRVPVLDTGKEILTESAAIMYYLALSYPERRLIPPTPMGFARTVEWTNWLSTVHAWAVAQSLRPERFTDDTRAHAAVKKKGLENLDELYRQIDEKLASTEWAIPDGYSIADANLLIFFKWGNTLGLDMNRHAHWCAHTKRMEQRPAVQAVLKAEQSTVWQ